MRALIVEDDKPLARTLGEMLKSIHFESDISYDGESGLDNGLSGVYDLIVLDIMLPKRDGFSIAKELRKGKIDTPILMLTARTEIDDRVKGLDSGADYYLTKPFEMSELLACVRALTRRQGEVVMDELSFGELKLNLSTCDLSYGDKKVRLGKKEFSLMRIFMSVGGAIVSKETLINKVWGQARPRRFETAGEAVQRAPVRAQLPLLLALRYAPHLLRPGGVVHQDDRGEG